jgi:hypothetical protein
MACALTTNILTTPTPVPTTTSTITITPTITLTPTVTTTPTPGYEVEAGTQARLPAGGFSIARIKGYDSRLNTASLSMLSDDGKVRVYVSAYVNKSPLGTRSLAGRSAQSLQEDIEDFQAADPLVEQHGDVERASVEFSGTQDDEPVRGRLMIFASKNSKYLYMLIMAVGDQRWEREGQKVHDILLTSLSFFSIQTLDPCPTQTNSGYGASPDYPIRIGGGLRNGEQRIFNYLDALVGPRGELVAYYRIGTVENAGVNLEQYTIMFGNQRKDLYFDIYTGTDLTPPAGLTCSAPLPQTLK